jgi:fumarate hydratase class II
MPGKVNPTQCEALTMVCAQVMGMMWLSLWRNARALRIECFQTSDGCKLLTISTPIRRCLYVFDEHCAQGIEPNYKRIKELVDNSLSYRFKH